MRRHLVLLLLAACQQAPAQPPTRTPVTLDEKPIPVDAAPVTECMSDERQWGTTCCRSEGGGDRHGERTWLTCRGPQLGKPCHRKSDCDVACSCDSKWTHHDGMRGVSGTCTGDKRSGEWLCELDDNGAVMSLIID